MSRSFVLACAAAFALPAAVSATPNAAAPAQPAEKAEAQPEERKICRRIETTGARTGGQRVCLTREEWRRIDREGR